MNERFDPTLEELSRFHNRFSEARFVLKSTGIYEGIEAKDFKVWFAHPLKVRTIAEARKTERGHYSISQVAAHHLMDAFKERGCCGHRLTSCINLRL